MSHHSLLHSHGDIFGGKTSLIAAADTVVEQGCQTAFFSSQKSHFG
jgi:hypothetical protein